MEEIKLFCMMKYQCVTLADNELMRIKRDITRPLAFHSNWKHTEILHESIANVKFNTIIDWSRISIQNEVSNTT